MAINRVAFGVLAATCVAAAGGGAYLATRHNQATIPALPESVEIQNVPGAPSVAETESIVDDVATFREQPGGAVVEEAAKPQSPRAATTAAAVAKPETAGRRAEAPREKPRAMPTSSSRTSRPADRTSAPTNSERESRRGSAPSTDAAPSAAEAPQPVLAPAPVESLPPIPATPEKTLVDLTVPGDSVLGLQIDTSVTSEKAKVEDKVEARVTRDVNVGGEVAIPAGSRVEGAVTLVEKGGKVKERARLGIRFHTLVLADGTKVPLRTETVFRDGASPAKESTAKIGGAAVGGAILGAILGGGKGAAIGGAVGASGGTAAVMAGDRNPATLPAGSTVTVRILSPVTVTVEK